MRIRLVLLTAGAVLLAGRAALAEGNGYSWSTASPGESIQYGLPGSDDRALRIDCTGHRQLEVMGPTQVDADEGHPTTVRLAGDGRGVTYKGELVALGDGNNFDVKVKAGDPVITALLAGHDVKVTEAGRSYTVPGKGARGHMARLLKACRG